MKDGIDGTAWQATTALLAAIAATWTVLCIDNPKTPGRLRAVSAGVTTGSVSSTTGSIHE